MQKIVDVLHETALLSSGFFPENPGEYGGKVFKVLGLAMANSSLEQQPSREATTAAALHNFCTYF